MSNRDTGGPRATSVSSVELPERLRSRNPQNVSNNRQIGKVGTDSQERVPSKKESGKDGHIFPRTL